MADSQLSIPPGLQTAVQRAVKAAVSEALVDVNLFDLKTCQEQLVATREALLDMQQNFLVWQELAKMRGDENERLKAGQEQMHRELTDLKTQIILLRSALDNRDTTVTS